MKRCKYCGEFLTKTKGRQSTCSKNECKIKLLRESRRRRRQNERNKDKELIIKPRRVQPGYIPPTYEVVTSFRSRELLAADGDRRVARWMMEDGARMPDLKNSDEVEL